MIFEDIKIYLPKFLSADSEKELFSGLKEFPENIDTRFYSEYLQEQKLIFQGDGLSELLIVNLPDTVSKSAPGMILSNTCDIHLENSRNFPSQIVYSPIINLEKYKKKLIDKSTRTKEQIEGHIQSIRKQEVTQIFYLPEYPDRLEESLVFLDRLNNFPNKLINRDSLSDKRLFTLSDYGAYLFVLKMSIHFTRIQDKVDRKSIRI